MPVPAIAVSFAKRPDRTMLQIAKEHGMDVAELRMDLYGDLNNERWSSLLEVSPVPTIATLRHEDEGGSWGRTESERRPLFRSWIPGASAIDVELAHSKTIEKLKPDCEAAGTSIIGSFHNFNKTPSKKKLTETLDIADSCGVDVVKIAVSIHSLDDIQRLTEILLSKPKLPKIVLGMGPQGKISRLLFPALGSKLTFAYVGIPTAPGQPSLDELVQARSDWYQNQSN